MQIGESIRAARAQRGLTQIQLAEKAGISVNALRLYEGGKRDPQIKTLEQIAEAVNIPVEKLLVFSEWSETFDDAKAVSKAVTAAGNVGLAAELADEALDLGLESDMADDLQIANRISDAISLLNFEGRYRVMEFAEALAETTKYQREK